MDITFSKHKTDHKHPTPITYLEPLLTCGLLTRPAFFSFIALISPFNVPPGSGTYQNSTVKSVNRKSSIVSRGETSRSFARSTSFHPGPRRSTRSTSFHAVPHRSKAQWNGTIRRQSAANSFPDIFSLPAFPPSVTIYDLRFTIYYPPSQPSQTVSDRLMLRARAVRRDDFAIKRGL